MTVHDDKGAQDVDLSKVSGSQQPVINALAKVKKGSIFKPDDDAKRVALFWFGFGLACLGILDSWKNPFHFVDALALFTAGAGMMVASLGGKQDD